MDNKEIIEKFEKLAYGMHMNGSACYSDVKRCTTDHSKGISLGCSSAYHDAGNLILSLIREIEEEASASLDSQAEEYEKSEKDALWERD